LCLLCFFSKKKNKNKVIQRITSVPRIQKKTKKITKTKQQHGIVCQRLTQREFDQYYRPGIDQHTGAFVVRDARYGTAVHGSAPSRGQGLSHV